MEETTSTQLESSAETSSTSTELNKCKEYQKLLKIKNEDLRAVDEKIAKKQFETGIYQYRNDIKAEIRELEILIEHCKPGTEKKLAEVDKTARSISGSGVVNIRPKRTHVREIQQKKARREIKWQGDKRDRNLLQ